jgi:hypothetical protein
MVSLTWQFQAAVPGGPSLILNQPSIEISGYDVAAVTVPASAANFAVPAVPASSAGDVILLVISSSKYDAGINYQVDGGASHVLDGPHLMVGSGAVAMLNGGTPPQKLSFNNTLTSDISIQILVGRKVP